MEDTKRTKEPKKLAEMQEEIIAILNKLVASMEMNTSLLQENTQLKLELQARDTMHVPPLRNGVLKIVEEPAKN